MHDLEAKIAQWRTALIKALPRQAGTVRELESHLRDQIDDLVSGGMEPEAAFELSQQRIGAPSSLAHEFSQLRPLLRNVSIPTLSVYGAIGVLSTILLFLLVIGHRHGRFGLLIFAHILTITVGNITVFGIGTLGLCSLIKTWAHPLSDEDAKKSRRSLLPLTIGGTASVAIGVVLGMIWAEGHLGRCFSLTSPRELGALLILFWLGAMLTAQLRDRLSGRFLCIMAVLGNAVAAIGWFGADAIATSKPIAWFAFAFAASQITLVSLRPIRAFLAKS